MKKRFNTTGVCIPRKHYMVNIDNKLDKIENMINYEEYFVINRPRQYGKTTTMFMLKKRLSSKYLVISCSFEGIGDSVFEEESIFVKSILELFADKIKKINEEYSEILYDMSKNNTTLKQLSDSITKFIRKIVEEVILLIDEVDKCSNNQLFLSFLGMLRNKYLAREQEEDDTFKSVILAGVHDVKNLKLKLRDNTDKKLNSPWNIAVDFNVDMSFDCHEIESMIIEYCSLNNVQMNTKEIAEYLYYYTSGYPFLVSRLCKIIDEDIFDGNANTWTKEDIDRAVKIILKDNNTLFDDLIKNLENNPDVYNFIEGIILEGIEIPFILSDIVISQCSMFGIIKEEEGKCKINNRIFELAIYNHMAIKVLRENNSMSRYNFKDNFLTQDGGLDIENILLRFQQFMKEQYSSIDMNFIEREGRLLFLAFIKPIINGVGFDFKEVQISEEKRLDIVITYNTFKYIIELKIWNGIKYHEKGIEQLCNYLDIHNMNKGYLVIFNFNKNKEYKKEIINIENKYICAAFV